MPSVATTATQEELTDRLDIALQDESLPDEQVIDELARGVEGGLLTSGGGRFFAWAIGGTLPAALAADWLSAAWDQISFDQELISRFDYEKAVFDRELARTERETAELQLRYTDVKAPFGGRVTAKEIVVGQATQPGDPLFTLADFSTLIVKLFLPEKDVFQLEPGQPVRLVPEALAAGASSEDVGVRARVRDLSPVVDPKTGTVKVTVEVIDRSTTVRPGAFVRAEIETDRREGAVLVPKLAVVKEGGQDFLFIEANGVAEKRVVELGYTRGGAIEVVSGVSAGERVIVAGHTALDDGETVDVLTR